MTTPVKKKAFSGDILSPQGEGMENLENIHAVQRMQSFIEAHLADPITLHMLPKAAIRQDTLPGSSNR